jgi:undecaprenyl pyrophosphate synthase
MDDLETFDPSLFGVWPGHRAYDAMVELADRAPAYRALADEVRAAVLEVKSANGAIPQAEELRQLLNEMTVEMRDEFAAFRRMRTSAERALEDGDDAAQKLARADVKAATDAMSLIVRTLEKIDSLQRQQARDRELEIERTENEGGYEEAVRAVEELIEKRAQEIFAQRNLAAGLDQGKPGGETGGGPLPPDTG